VSVRQFAVCTEVVAKSGNAKSSSLTEVAGASHYHHVTKFDKHFLRGGEIVSSFNVEEKFRPQSAGRK